MMIVKLMFWIIFSRSQVNVPTASIWTSDGTVGMAMDKVSMDDVKTTPFERRFNPYDFNGG